MNESPSEVAWAHWLGNVEFDIGHSLDGDDERAGFSLEKARALFEADFSVEEAIAEMVKNGYGEHINDF